jgi:multiple sugar transport system substrate-binding protein
MRRKTARAALLASLLSVSLWGTIAGCGVGGAPGQQAPGEVESLPPGQPVQGEITFWHSYSADSAELTTLRTKLIPDFQAKHPGTTVRDVSVPADDMHQKVVTAAAGGDLPDVMRSDIVWSPELAKLGVLLPLDQAMPDFQQLAGDTYEAPLATNKYKDHYYGLPLDTNTKVTLYNQETLNAAGVPAVPATFQELRDAGAKLAAGGKFVLAENGTAGWNVLPYIWSAGGQMTDEAVTKSDGFLNGPKAVAGVQLLVDLYQAKALPNIVLGKQAGTSLAEGLAKGSYATATDGPWQVAVLEKQYPGAPVKTAPLPKGDGGGIGVIGGENIVITRLSDNQKLAAEFTRYMLSESAQLEMARVGQMPVLKKLGDQVKAMNAYYPTYVDQLATARPRPPTPAWQKIDEILKNQVQKAIRGDMPVQEALDEAVSQIDPLLAQG